MLAISSFIFPGKTSAQNAAPPGDARSRRAKPAAHAAAAWRFVVSGDSRNCGDVVMPAIAARMHEFEPSFYWHLGDLRAIYKIDEDMAFAAANSEHPLSCGGYEETAWTDFIGNQINAFGDIPFYLGIGNHEVIPPKTEDEFKRTFARWMDLPALRRQREKDKTGLELYYHWVQGGVDFIYLDNAEGFFGDGQLNWLRKRLEDAQADAQIRSVVVGMHEALPQSLANSHSMGDKGPESPGWKSGSAAYAALLDFRERSRKPVYVLASHFHNYMENIYDTAPLKLNGTKPLPGWIVGTAGAVRYVLPVPNSPSAITDVYGFLVGTVSANGTIRFSFEEVHESDVPERVRQRYDNALVPWCFAHNSMNRDPGAKDITADCPVASASR
jgi:hypothetical protein